MRKDYIHLLTNVLSFLINMLQCNLVRSYYEIRIDIISDCSTEPNAAKKKNLWLSKRKILISIFISKPKQNSPHNSKVKLSNNLKCPGQLMPQTPQSVGSPYDTAVSLILQMKPLVWIVKRCNHIDTSDAAMSLLFQMTLSVWTLKKCNLFDFLLVEKRKTLLKESFRVI